MSPRYLFVPFLALSIMLAACEVPHSAESTAPVVLVQTEADSLAMEMVSSLGGLEAWSEMPYLQFDFSVGSEESRRSHRKHLWDLQTGRYRIEYSLPQDTLVTVIFNVDDTTGTAFFNGQPTDAATADNLVSRAHRMYINDTYWLLAPLKVFDDGVNREMGQSDSVDEDMLVLSFDGVGYTPGDQYWFGISRDTKMLASWTYQLQGRDGRSTYDWTGYQTYETPAGPVRLSSAKVSERATIFTDNISFPDAVSDALFSDGQALLD